MNSESQHPASPQPVQALPAPGSSAQAILEPKSPSHTPSKAQPSSRRATQAEARPGVDYPRDGEGREGREDKDIPAHVSSRKGKTPTAPAAAVYP